MSKGIVEVIAGAALIAVDVAFLGANPSLILIGAGLIVGGIGSLLNQKKTGLEAETMNPIAPRNVIYGRAVVGGVTVFIEETGTDDKYLHMVRVLAAHPSQALDAVRFDNKRLPLDGNGNSYSFKDSTPVIANQKTVAISTITRVGATVTVVMAGSMQAPAPLGIGQPLMDGDQVQIKNVSTDQTLNGIYQIQLLDSVTFIYVCGGNPVSISGQGQVITTWPDYGDTVHMEYALGTQAPGSPPFPGLISGTGQSGTDSNGLWTSQHLLQGMTAVYLRLKYGGNTYVSGLPSIRFQVRGKNDIADVRTSPATIGYTENSALIIADYLANQDYGFKATYGTEIPLPPLIAAANLCDENVQIIPGSALVAPTNEPRYTCNGGFLMSVKRGEVLQNLLTSCAGRLTYSGGQFVIQPAAWVGPSLTIGQGTVTGPVITAKMPVSAVLTVIASWVQGSSGIGTPTIDGFFGNPYLVAIPLGAAFGLDLTGINSTPQAFTYTLTPPQLALLGELSVAALIVGTLSGVDNPPFSTLNIYDCNLLVTYGDSTTSTIRPGLTATQTGTASGIFNVGFSGQVANPNNAIDSDPTTFASVTRQFFSSLARAGYLQMIFLPQVGTPDTTPPGVLATGLALAITSGPFQWKPKLSVRDLFNGVKGTYVCPANNWQASDFPPYMQDTAHGYNSTAGSPPTLLPQGDAYLAADGGERRWREIQLPFTISSSAAQRLAKIALLRHRQQGTGTFAFNLALYQSTALDVIEMTLPLLGWYNKLLEISAHRFTVTKQNREDGSEVTLLGTELDLQETDPSVYTWSTFEELSGQGYQVSHTPNTSVAGTPTGVTATPGPGGSISVAWNQPHDGYVLNGAGYTQIQYQPVGSTSWTAVANTDTTSTNAYINGLSDGQYNLRVASVNTAGAISDWVTTGPVTASGGGRNIPNFADDETPQGPYDGVGTVYTLLHSPAPQESLELFYNGVQQLHGVEYSLSGNIITFLRSTNLPDDAYGESLRCWYRY